MTIININTRIITVMCHYTASNPGASTSQFFGGDTSVFYGLSTTSTTANIPFVGAGSLIAVAYHHFMGGVGSGESVTLAFRLNDTTDTNLDTALTFNATSNTQTYVAPTDFTAPTFSKDDTFEFKLVFPAMVTPPTVLTGTAIAYFEMDSL